MNKLTKKITISIVILATAATMVPSMVKAVTIAELQAQIDALLLQLAALQAQVGGTSAPAACAGIASFATNLSQGSTGADVKCLQALLNASADTQVAASGVGSAGNETMTFGPLTKAAVMKYQTKNSISPVAGYVGPITRAKLNTALGGGTPGVDVCPNIAGVQTTVPTGKVKDTSGNCVDEGTGTGGITTPGAEGALVATLASSVADNKDVYTKTSDNAVVGVELQAVGSDILVKRFDATFNKRPWLYIKNITITDGTTSKTIAVTEANSNELTVGSSYTIIMDSLSFLLPKGTKKVFTVKVDGVDELPSGVTSQAVTIQAGANAFRGLDGAGTDQYAPSAALSARTFTSKSGDTANIEVTAHADNPKDRSVVVPATSEVTGVVLAKINLKATNRNAILRTITAEDSNADGTTAASSVLKTVYVYDGDTQLSSTSSIFSASSGIVLTNIDLTIPKDTTKTLTIKADLYKSQNYITNATATNASSDIAFEATATGFDAEDAATFATATISGSSPDSGGLYVYPKAPQFALLNATITSNEVSTGTIKYNGKALARIKINVTANGGDIYIASTTASDAGATSSIGASTTVVGATTISSDADVTSGLENFVIKSGQTKYIEFAPELTRIDDPAGSSGVGDLQTYVYVNPLPWQDADANSRGSDIIQDWGLTDMKTGNIVLEYLR